MAAGRSSSGLVSFWLQSSFPPVSGSLPSVWDSIAGVYATCRRPVESTQQQPQRGARHDDGEHPPHPASALLDRELRAEGAPDGRSTGKTNKRAIEDR